MILTAGSSKAAEAVETLAVRAARTAERAWDSTSADEDALGEDIRTQAVLESYQQCLNFLLLR